MDSTVNFWQIAVDLIIACVIVGIVVAGARATISYVNSSTASLEEQSAEYAESDVRALAKRSVTGADVINTVRKYKQEYSFLIETSTGSREISVNSPFVNSPDGEGYVNPDNWFDCEIEENLNGNVVRLTFTERGELNTVDATSVTSVKQLIVETINSPSITLDSTWEEIQEFLESNVIDAGTRENLVAAIPNGTGSDTWEELVSKAVIALGELQSGVQYSDSGSTGVRKGTVSRKSNSILAEVPKVLLVSTYNDSEYLYCDGSWYQVVISGTRSVYVFGQWYEVSLADVSDKFALSGSTFSNMTEMAISYQYTVE